MITCEFENNQKTTQLRHCVVDGIVVRDNQILLTRRADWLVQGGKWALPGGFVDRDELIEDAVLREVREETGYEATITRRIAILDDPNRNDDRQNIGFIYELAPQEQTGTMDEHEVAEMKWFAFDKLPPKEEWAFDHYEIIQQFLKPSPREI